MVRRDPKRPPIHPGEILREDVLPSLNMPVLPQLKTYGSRVRRFTACLLARRPFRRKWRCGLASSAAMAPRYGFACRQRTTCGMPPGGWR